jgi:hypothetical protein
MFSFEGVVFDAEYFRQKVAESRQRKKEQKQRVQQMLSECRSAPLGPAVADLASVPGLIGALNRLTEDVEASFPQELRSGFDLGRYQRHITSQVGNLPTDLLEIPPLVEDLRLDLIWKFIAAIFLDHAGLVDLNQEGQTIWVMKIDDREGQDISGNSEEADGFEGSLGGTQAW